MRKIKGPLIIILGISATAGATIAFASTPPSGGRGPVSAEPPMERTLDYSETVPNLAASKFIIASDNDQAPASAVIMVQAIQNGRGGRTVLDRGGAETQVNDTQSRNAVAMISTTIWIRAPTNGNPAKTA
jgi:hypothetical protein